MMRLLTLRWPLVLIAPLLVVSACSELFGPDEPDLLPEAELTFVRMASDAPPMDETVVTFWAVRGQQREAQIRYTSNLYDGKCLLFRVPALALPAGTAPGDSVQITIRMVDPEFFRFEFEPAGLKFDPAHPAEMEVRYRWANPDYNGDGVVDQRDRAIEESFGIWHQEQPGARWKRIATTRQRAIFEAQAKIASFSQYALASE